MLRLFKFRLVCLLRQSAAEAVDARPTSRRARKNDAVDRSGGKRASERAHVDSDYSDSERDAGLSKDSKIIPLELPKHIEGYQKAATGKTNGVRKQLQQ